MRIVYGTDFARIFREYSAVTTAGDKYGDPLFHFPGFDRITACTSNWAKIKGK